VIQLGTIVLSYAAVYLLGFISFPLAWLLLELVIAGCEDEIR